MKHTLICPRTEICPVYGAYVDQTQDDALGVIRVETIENRPFYACGAFSAVQDWARGGQLDEAMKKRVDGVLNCLLIDQANKSVNRGRPDM